MKTKRTPCPRCTIKHLAQAWVLLTKAFRYVRNVSVRRLATIVMIARAYVLMNEVRKGYPHHVWLAMGHLAEAEDEILDFMPVEAKAIRRERKKLEFCNIKGDVYNTEPLIGLMYQVASEAMLEETQTQGGNHGA